MNIRNSNEWASIPIDSLKPYGRRIRRHGKKSISKLKKLIGHFGQVLPIIVDANRIIIDGHAVWQAMRELGAGEIATITVAGRNDPDVKALRLALNRLPEEAAWDNKELRAEFEELLNLSFDLELTGFDTVEFDHALNLDLPPGNQGEDDSMIPPALATAVTRPGDIWRCGDHRVGCGSAHDREFLARVREGHLADVAFTAPPHNMPIIGFVSGNGRNQHREFLQGAGEMSPEQFTAFLTTALDVLKVSCSPRALIYACMDRRHVHDLLSAGIRSVLELHDVCVWAKTEAEMGSHYRNQYELVCVFKASTEAPAQQIGLGCRRRARSNLWTYPGVNLPGAEVDGPGAMHSIAPPVALIADVLRDVTKRAGIVLDTFMGAGSTLIAAQQTGRRCFGIELDPRHVDVAVLRWQAQTKGEATCVKTGETFGERAQLCQPEAHHVGQ